jgi:RNA polymerase sigma-70 factor, ECF subfamily
MEYERFASLVGPHSDAMAHVAAALVGMADAEDAAQEALLRAWRAWPTLRDAGAVRVWLLRITTNVCRNWQTGHFGTHRRATQSLDDAASLALLLHSRATGARAPGSGDHADALDLQHAVAALNDDLRQVVALRYFAQMDASEIGDLLETPPATIRTRLRRALMLLRDALGPAACDDAAAAGDSTHANDTGRSGRSARTQQAQLERGA